MFTKCVVQEIYEDQVAGLELVLTGDTGQEKQVMNRETKHSQ